MGWSGIQSSMQLATTLCFIFIKLILRFLVYCIYIYIHKYKYLPARVCILHHACAINNFYKLVRQIFCQKKMNETGIGKQNLSVYEKFHILCFDWKYNNIIFPFPLSLLYFAYTLSFSPSNSWPLFSLMHAIKYLFIKNLIVYVHYA